MRGHCTNSVGKIQSKKRQIVISEVKVQNVHIRVIFFMVNAAKSLLDCYFGKWILKYSTIHIMIEIGHFLNLFLPTVYYSTTSIGYFFDPSFAMMV